MTLLPHMFVTLLLHMFFAAANVYSTCRAVVIQAVVIQAVVIQADVIQAVILLLSKTKTGQKRINPIQAVKFSESSSLLFPKSVDQLCVELSQLQWLTISQSNDLILITFRLFLRWL